MNDSNKKVNTGDMRQRNDAECSLCFKPVHPGDIWCKVCIERVSFHNAESLSIYTLSSLTTDLQHYDNIVKHFQNQKLSLISELQRRCMS